MNYYSVNPILRLSFPKIGYLLLSNSLLPGLFFVEVIGALHDHPLQNIYGYALVSDDGYSYDIIDKDFNVVGEDVIQGNGAYLRSGNSPVFAVLTDNGYTDILVK